MAGALFMWQVLCAFLQVFCAQGRPAAGRLAFNLLAKLAGFSPLEQICTFACWILIKAIFVDFMVEGPCFSGRHRGPVLLPWLARQGLPNPVVTSCDISWLWGLRCCFRIKGHGFGALGTVPIRILIGFSALGPDLM